jgi:selenocysteine lyase/cysteine desulfurase
VRLFSLTWASANGGLIELAVEVGRIARMAGVPYFLDATQADGQMPADVRELDCDVLTTNARKYLRGLGGVALLSVEIFGIASTRVSAAIPRRPSARRAC